MQNQAVAAENSGTGMPVGRCCRMSLPMNLSGPSEGEWMSRRPLPPEEKRSNVVTKLGLLLNRKFACGQ
jgi:hypothetical protein